ncbi:MAG: fibronectin type III domain-containing protein [Planctomycetales bacterium]
MSPVLRWPLISACLSWAIACGFQPAAAGVVDKNPFADHPLNEWVLQSPRDGAPIPDFGWEGSGSWDPVRRQWIHYGGHDGTPQGFILFTADLVTGKWRQKFPNTSPPGVCCVDGTNVFDPVNGRFIAFPGGWLGHGWQFSRGVKLKDSPVWAYDPAANRWTNMRPAPYTGGHRSSREGMGYLNGTATYDSNHEVALSFGGQNSTGGTNSLWAYDVYANDLQRLPAADPPSPRDGTGVCYDEAHDCLVMFGSQYGSDERTWIYRYDAGRWEGHDLEPRPPGAKARTYSTIPRLAYDPLNKVCLCLVRLDGAGGRLDTWALDAGKLEWRKMEPQREPDPSMSRARNLSFISEYNLFILENQASEGRRSNQLWTYRYAVPAEDPRPRPPVDLSVVTADDRATLSWKPAEGPRPAKYRVYRAQAEHAWLTKFEPLAETDAPTHVDAGLERGKTYFYQVAAIDAEGRESDRGRQARTQPRVVETPVVRVLAADRIEVAWPKSAAPDIAGYDVYRGDVRVSTVTKGPGGAWRDNDPEYPEPLVNGVRDIRNIRKLNDQPLAESRYVDTQVDLAEKDADAGDYRYSVKAYIVRAVNRLGTESGPSPYALTIPAEPQHVLLRERSGDAEIKWEPSPEREIAGYRVYKLDRAGRMVERVTDDPIQTTTFTHVPGHMTRYVVTAVDKLGQEGQPSSPVWFNKAYLGFFEGEWHQ